MQPHDAVGVRVATTNITIEKQMSIANKVQDAIRLFNPRIQLPATTSSRTGTMITMTGSNSELNSPIAWTCCAKRGRSKSFATLAENTTPAGRPVPIKHHICLDLVLTDRVRR